MGSDGSPLPKAPLRKAERHRLIGSLVTRRRLSTQLELEQALGRAGCSVAQATLSRDLRELGIVKVADGAGRPRYVLPGAPQRLEPRAALAAILGRSAARVTAAQNIVVIESELGSAPAIARALDRVGHSLVVGTLAGDDTCLVIARTRADAERLASELG